MSEKSDLNERKAAIVIVAVFVCFYFFGVWAGALSIFAGMIYMGWSDRRKGPLPAKRENEPFE
tara:strand:+ start:334 stop:522 length:189 start_codon:yes stop_codon:yes gene_type:complete